MKHAFLRRGALLLCAWLTASAAAMPCAAENDDIILPHETEENEAFVSGDYTYSLLTDSEDEDWQAICIEGYTGREKDLVIPSEIDGMEVYALGDRAFVANYNLQTVTLPETLVLLGTYTFADCTRLTAYEVADGNEVFESRDGVLYAEDGASLVRYPVGTLPTEIDVPRGVVSIGNAAFASCPTLTKVTLPTTLAYIGKSAFSDCVMLTEITIPEGVAEIGDFAFNSCTRLAQVRLPSTLQTIGGASFAATAIESVALPSGLVSVGQQAFAATKMTEVTIPSSVTSIGYDAFGWDVNADGELFMNSDFVIYGTAGSAAERYASDSEEGNNFTFTAIEEEEPATTESAAAEDTAPEDAPPDTKPTGAVRIIGIAVCCVLIAVVLIVAIATGKKKPSDDTPKAENQEEEPKDEA